MTGEQLERLMWEKIDGTLSDEDAARLGDYVREHPEAIEGYEELARLARMLDGVAEVDPPPALRPGVMRAIGRDCGRTSPRAPEAWWRRLFAAPGGLRYAYVAAASFALGVLVYSVVDYQLTGDQNLDISDFYGTMNVEPTRGEALDIDTGLVRGSIEFRRERNVIVSRVEFVSDEDVELVIDHGGRSVRYGGLRGRDGTLGQVTSRENAFSLRNRGSGAYYFAFEPDREAPIEVTISARDSVLFRARVEPGRIPTAE